MMDYQPMYLSKRHQVVNNLSVMLGLVSLDKPKRLPPVPPNHSASAFRTLSASAYLLPLV